MRKSKPNRLPKHPDWKLDYSQLFIDTANLDWNISIYDGLSGGTLDGFVTLEEFLPKARDDGDIFFEVDGYGQVSVGWSGGIGNDGIVNLTNNGFSYDVWSTGLTMITFLGIDNSLFTDPSTGTIATITFSSSATITDFASGTSGISVMTADGFAYEVQTPVEPEVSISRETDSLVITFTGILQSSITLSGWADLDPQPASPYIISLPTAEAKRFFRARD